MAYQLNPANKEAKEALDNLEQELKELYDTTLPEWMLSE